MTGRTYDVMNIALPRKGFNGADSTDDNTAWKNNMAESEGKYVKEASKQQQRLVRIAGKKW